MIAKAAGRIGGNRGNRPNWVSRDYADDYQPKCAVAYCPCNRSGHCETPTQIDIRSDGVCQKAIDFKP